MAGKSPPPPSRVELVNLTPHPLHFYRRGVSEVPILVVPSHGDLRLASAEQRELPPVTCGPDGVLIPVLTGQRFEALDFDELALSAWTAKPEGVFVVSLPVAQFIAERAEDARLGKRRICCPGTGPKNAVRDAKGVLIGTYALEIYI